MKLYLNFVLCKTDLNHIKISAILLVHVKKKKKNLIPLMSNYQKGLCDIVTLSNTAT